jgi:proteasome lid subunit RPN8/RPN11
MIRRQTEGRRFLIEGGHGRCYAPQQGDAVAVPERAWEQLRDDTRRAETYGLVVRAPASLEIANHIGWGGETDGNQSEQGGLLLGRVWRHPSESWHLGVVDRAVPGLMASGSMSYLHFSHGAWKAMLDEIDRLREAGETSGQVIGWYHTHPRHLRVFMSGTDLATQKRLFSCDWHFALVINPQKCRLRAYRGRDAHECSVIVDEALERDRSLRARGTVLL